MVEETRVSFTAQQLLSSASYTLLHLEGPSWSDHQPDYHDHSNLAFDDPRFLVMIMI